MLEFRNIPWIQMDTHINTAVDQIELSLKKKKSAVLTSGTVLVWITPTRACFTEIEELTFVICTLIFFKWLVVLETFPSQRYERSGLERLYSIFSVWQFDVHTAEWLANLKQDIYFVIANCCRCWYWGEDKIIENMSLMGLISVCVWWYVQTLAKRQIHLGDHLLLRKYQPHASSGSQADCLW